MNSFTRRERGLGLDTARRVAAGCAIFAFSAGCGPSEPARSPNLLLVTIDTLRADRIGCYGDRQAATPVLDALCAEGWKADPVLTPVPLTLPAHATILTGKEPPEHGVRANGAFALREAHQTLAEILRRAGYATGAFVGAFPLDHRFGLNQGFDSYDDRTDEAGPGFHYRERRAEAVIRSATDWLARHDSRPFFAWVHLFDPHDPYDPPEPFASRFYTDPYRGEVAYVDASLGALFQRLKDAGRWGDTVVIVTADHGEGLGEHGEDTHGFFVYEATTRVPLIIKAAASHRKQTPATRQADRLSRIMPAALSLLGLWPRAGSGSNGASEGKAGPIYLECLAPQLDYNWSPLFAVRSERWKYTQAPIPELYDLSDDPHELRNLAEASGHQERSRQLRAQLNAMHRSLERGETRRARAIPDREVAEGLAALGYVGSTALGSLETAAGRTLKDPKQMLPLAKEIDAASELEPGRVGLAIQRLEALSRQDPGNNLIYRRLAAAYERTKDWPRAAQAYDSAMARGYLTTDIASANAHAHLRAGAEADARGSMRAAGEAFARAIELTPEDPLAVETRGVWLAHQGRLTEAREHFRRALELDPERWEPHYQLGVLALQMNDPAKGIRELEMARSKAPADPEILFALGEAYRRTGQTREVVTFWRKFLEVAASADSRRANVERDLRRLAEATSR